MGASGLRSSLRHHGEELILVPVRLGQLLDAYLELVLHSAALGDLVLEGSVGTGQLLGAIVYALFEVDVGSAELLLGASALD